MLVQAIRRSPLLRIAIDLRVTVVSLALLFLLTLLGTFHQVSHGLYDAQQRYFGAWITLVGGIVPLPGAQLVLWVLFVNLVAVTAVRFVYRWSRVGILITHLGMFVMFFGMFFVSYFAQESFLRLQEGEWRNTSEDYHEWEIAAWREGADARDVSAVDLRQLAPGDQVTLPALGLTMLVEENHPSADAYLPAEGRSSPFLNARGIAELRPRRRSVRPEENQPGAILDVGTGSEGASLALWALDPAPTSVTLDGKRYSFSLRRTRYELPALIGLQEFRAEFHPGTDTPRSFESDVVVEAPGTRRPVRISMNKPLRFGGFTFYQASYEFDATGAAYSTLAVVENRGRIVPYVGTAVISIGLIVHFIQTLARPGRRRRTAGAEAS
ncbi:MAG: cytochrome c biogenesis protein ResB [Spirochaetaceae bacterium]|nr:cytochrome c biogenesis protein ResB [Spirochaetaceae bacterium]